jgi:hypothetical protein
MKQHFRRYFDTPLMPQSDDGRIDRRSESRHMARSTSRPAALGLTTALVAFGVSALAMLGGCRDRSVLTQKAMGEAELQQRLEQATRNLAELCSVDAKRALDPIQERRLDVDLLRAQLAITIGDCEGAAAVLSSHRQEVETLSVASTARPSSSAPGVSSAPVSSGSARATELFSVAEGCARAMAGAEIATDETRGVWVRFQNTHDRVLLPIIAEVADTAARAIGEHLQTTLERPLRIEVVADLASLSAVTGLPLEAAETTGTIAIARWGKVTLVSPRATREGYPWQDTLAHELTHLIVARKSRDLAPLWLQEGIAKREETRWREPRPLDLGDEVHREARQALVEGRAIPIDRLGASMAFLPTPRAAETAYAEVHDFLEYWIKNNGELALALLLREIGELGDRVAQRALVSVSGYTFAEWVLRWQRALLDESRSASTGSSLASDTRDSRGRTPAFTSEDSERAFDVARRMRLAELVEERRDYAAVREILAPLAETETRHHPQFSQRLAHASLMLGELGAARDLVEPPEQVSYLDGTWLAVRGRILNASGDDPNAEAAFRQALAFAPTLDKVACRGFLVGESRPPGAVPPLPEIEPWLSLCGAARAMRSH